MRTVVVETVNRSRRSLVPAALAVIAVITFISGGLTGDHPIRAVGGAVVVAAVLMAVMGWSLRHPDEATRYDQYHSASGASESHERRFLVVRPDQTELYESAVRAFGAPRVLYDRRQGERRRVMSAAPIERRQSNRRQRAELDFDIKAFGSAWIRPRSPLN